jgi:hypothetical protein
VLEFCEAKMEADTTASPEYSLTNSSAPAGSKPKEESSCARAQIAFGWFQPSLLFLNIYQIAVVGHRIVSRKEFF